MEYPHQKATLEGQTAEPPPGPGERAYQDCWFALAPRPWSSLLLVPGDDGTSADEVARRLASIGKQLHSGPVTVVTVSSLDFGTASALGRLPGFLEQMQREARSGPERLPFEMPPSGAAGRDQAGEGRGPRARATGRCSASRRLASPAGRPRRAPRGAPHHLDPIGGVRAPGAGHRPERRPGRALRRGRADQPGQREADAGPDWPRARGRLLPGRLSERTGSPRAGRASPTPRPPSPRTRRGGAA